MELKEIKNLIEKDGGKIIIIEGDNPAIVIMSFEEYKKTLEAKKETENQESKNSELQNSEDQNASSIQKNKEYQNEEYQNKVIENNPQVNLDDLPIQ